MVISTLYTAKPRGYWIFGGEDGIRTHVPGYPDQLISSQRRCDRFGTSPFKNIESVLSVYDLRKQGLLSMCCNHAPHFL